MRRILEIELDEVSGGMALHSLQAHAQPGAQTLPGQPAPFGAQPYSSYGNDPFAGGYNLTPYAQGPQSFPQAQPQQTYSPYGASPYASDPYAYGNGYGQDPYGYAQDPYGGYGYGQPQTIVVEQHHDNPLDNIGQIAGAIGPILGLFGGLAGGSR